MRCGVVPSQYESNDSTALVQYRSNAQGGTNTKPVQCDHSTKKNTVHKLFNNNTLTIPCQYSTSTGPVEHQCNTNAVPCYQLSRALRHRPPDGDASRAPGRARKPARDEFVRRRRVMLGPPSPGYHSLPGSRTAPIGFPPDWIPPCQTEATATPRDNKSPVFRPLGAFRGRIRPSAHSSSANSAALYHSRTPAEPCDATDTPSKTWRGGQGFLDGEPTRPVLYHGSTAEVQC